MPWKGTSTGRQGSQDLWRGRRQRLRCPCRARSVVFRVPRTLSGATMRSPLRGLRMGSLQSGGPAPGGKPYGSFHTAGKRIVKLRFFPLLPYPCPSVPIRGSFLPGFPSVFPEVGAPGKQATHRLQAPSSAVAPWTAHTLKTTIFSGRSIVQERVLNLRSPRAQA